MRTLAGFLGIGEVDGLDTDQRLVVLGITGRPHHSPDHITVSQAEAANLRGRHVDIVIARQKPGRAKKSVSLGEALERTAAEAETHLYRLRAQGAYDEIVLPQGRWARNPQLLRHLAKLRDRHRRKLAEHQPRSESHLLFRWFGDDHRRRARLDDLLRPHDVVFRRIVHFF